MFDIESLNNKHPDYNIKYMSSYMSYLKKFKTATFKINTPLNISEANKFLQNVFKNLDHNLSKDLLPQEYSDTALVVYDAEDWSYSKETIRLYLLSIPVINKYIRCLLNKKTYSIEISQVNLLYLYSLVMQDPASTENIRFTFYNLLLWFTAEEFNMFYVAIKNKSIKYNYSFANGIINFPTNGPAEIPTDIYFSKGYGLINMPDPHKQSTYISNLQNIDSVMLWYLYIFEQSIQGGTIPSIEHVYNFINAQGKSVFNLPVNIDTKVLMQILNGHAQGSSEVIEYLHKQGMSNANIIKNICLLKCYFIGKFLYDFDKIKTIYEQENSVFPAKIHFLNTKYVMITCSKAVNLKDLLKTSELFKHFEMLSGSLTYEKVLEGVLLC